MILLFCLFVLIWSISSICADNDREHERKSDFAVSERRHEEMLKAMSKEKAEHPKRTRIIVQDTDGMIIAQETVEL